ncbi:MAG: class I SAM-dependent DNA methyltransferase [Actinomycetota bacterium]
MTFGEETAARYDAISTRGDEDATVEFLEQLARGGPALELAIGTGRIALPLAARRVVVDGIDISPAMLARPRAKTGGDKIAVTIGDFADVPVSGTYRLVYVVFNTLFNLMTQHDQVRCFENVAAHLADDGAFVAEGFVPSFLYRLRDEQYVDAESLGVDHLVLDVGRHDPVEQRLDESHVVLSDKGVRLTPIVTRYVWPSELDLMARIAELRLEERWVGWRREPFAATGRNCISVYRR